MTPAELIEQTKRLVAIPSTADNPAALGQAVDFVADIVAKVPGVTVERFEKNGKPSFLAYRGTMRPEKFAILLNAHVDVVPGRPDQFQAVEKDGRLYGRGVLDMKGTTLVLADLFCQLVNEVPYSLGLQIVSDEEIGGYGGVHHQIQQGVRADFVVMGEYANEPDTIYNAARGLCWVEILFKGKTAHGGHLWHGQNAVIKAGDFAGEVLARYPTPDAPTWTTTASIASLSTPNDTYNKVPDSAVLKIDFRFTQKDPVFQNEASVRAFIASIDPDAELLAIPVFEPAVYVDQLNPYVQGLDAAFRRTTTRLPQYGWRPASSDGRHFALVGNDSVEFGLYGGGSHSDYEYVELSSFAEYQAVMREFLRTPTSVKLKKTIKKANEFTEPLHHKLLRELVAMPTVSGDITANNNALYFIEAFLSRRGMHVVQFESNGYRSIVATTKPNNKQPTVMLSAHIDVVPGNPEQFTLATDGDRLYGRGALDMKSAIASYLWLVDELQDDLDAYDFGIMINSDEEIGSQNGKKMLLDQEGYRAKVAVIPDSGENWQFESFAKGVQWIKLEATGKVAHASRPWEGDSAIRRLLDALREIELLVPANPAREDTILSVGTIQGGTVANQIPTAANAMLDIRYGSVADYEQLYPRIETVCQRHGVTSTLMVSDPPFISDVDDPYIKPFRQAVTRATGQPTTTSFSYAATDGRFFGMYNIPCVITTPPGDGRHKDNEWLSLRGFDQLCVILKQYIQEVAARKPLGVAALTEPTHVWYATYGTGLSREHFMQFINGGQFGSKTVRTYPGCSDTTPPLKTTFMALPHELYFAGNSETWGGGFVRIDPTVDRSQHTLSRAYLISMQQFKEIIAQENFRDHMVSLPLDAAKKHGHAPIGDGSGNYEELVYCGVKEGYPVYSVTTGLPRQAYNPPAPAYTQLLCQGLSENKRLGTEGAMEYLLHVSGMDQSYDKAKLTALVRLPNKKE